MSVYTEYDDNTLCSTRNKFPFAAHKWNGWRKTIDKQRIVFDLSLISAIASNEIIQQNRTDRLATQRRIELKSSIWCEFIRSQTVDVVLHTSEWLFDSVFIDSPDNNLCFQNFFVNQLKTVDTQSDQFIEGQNMNKQTKTSSYDFIDRNERDIHISINNSIRCALDEEQT